MQQLHRAWKATFALALAGAVVAQAGFAAPSFDGNWSVRITPENGDCSSRYTIPIEVADGHIRYTGDFQAQASGKIAANGIVKVRFAHKDDIVDAHGSLSGGSGHGSWKSPTKQCDGTWTAQRS